MLLDLQLNYDKAFSERLSTRGSVRMTRIEARDGGYATNGGSVSGVLAYRLGAPTLIAEATLGALKADERLSLFPRKREDRRIELSAGVLFSTWRLFDLSPVVRVKHTTWGQTLPFR